MATKKAGSTAKKTTKAKSTAAKPSTTTKVTTLGARMDSDSPSVTQAPSFGRSSRVNATLATALIAELIGTFLLSIAVLGTQGNPIYVDFAIAGVVLMVGTISGSHINPAITVGAWVTRKIDSLRAVLYIIAQLLGAGLAFTVMTLFLNSVSHNDSQTAAMGQQAVQLFKATPLTGQNQWPIFFVELVATSIFAFGVAKALRTADQLTAALTVGLSLLLAGIFGYTAGTAYLGGSSFFNPALALMAQAIDFAKFNIVVFAAYMIAPLIGGIIGFGLRDILTVKKDA